MMKNLQTTPSPRDSAKERISARYKNATDGISRNVEILLGTEPLWAVPVTWMRTYASLFMAALGLSATQIGWMASITLVVQMLVAPFGGYTADHFGRKRSLITFDIISWIMPLFVWMFAQNIWYFAVAAALNGVGMIIGPSWNCLLVEDTNPTRRPAVFAGFQLIVLGAGILSPISGWIVNSKGVIMGTRIIYGLTGLSIGIMTLIRALTVTETSVGIAIAQERQGQGAGIKDALQNYRSALLYGFRHPALNKLLLLSMINFAYTTIWTAYSALYMTHIKGLNLSPSLVAFWPTFSSVFMVLTLVFLVPRVRLEKLPEWLLFSSILLCLGVVVFMVLPPDSYGLLAIPAILIAVGTALVNPVRDTFIANIIDDRQRAPFLAAINSVSMCVLVPLTPLAGRLFDLNTRAPLYLLLGFLVVGVFAANGLKRVGASSDDE
ncbi:MAG: MFS transporter [Firmicutes bacterium]|nr:MFS transporter [Bacillota bacterium]